LKNHTVLKYAAKISKIVLQWDHERMRFQAAGDVRVESGSVGTEANVLCGCWSSGCDHIMSSMISIQYYKQQIFEQIFRNIRVTVCYMHSFSSNTSTPDFHITKLRF
jgi:hypothetical protein